MNQKLLRKYYDDNASYIETLYHLYLTSQDFEVINDNTFWEFVEGLYIQDIDGGLLEYEKERESSLNKKELK